MVSFTLSSCLLHGMAAPRVGSLRKFAEINHFFSSGPVRTGPTANPIGLTCLSSVTGIDDVRTRRLMYVIRTRSCSVRLVRNIECRVFVDIFVARLSITEMLLLLLRRCLLPWAAGPFYATPLHECSAGESQQCARSLAEPGADGYIHPVRAK